MKRNLLIAIALLVSGVGNLRADDVFKEVTGKITNPSFEDAGATTGDIQSGDITTGWTYTSQNNGRVSIFNSSSSVETYGSTSPSADKYFMRIRGAGGGSDGTQSVSQKNTFSLTKSKYRILFDYKAARANNTEKKFAISAKNGSNVLGSKQNTISQVSANSSYFAGIEWTTDYFDFTLTATTNVTLNISCETSKASSGHTILLLDNFILEWNLTQSLKDLITEANNFLTAEGDSEGTSYTALKSAIDDADAVKESDNASTLETQYGLLEAALNLAKNHRKPWLAAKTAAEAAIANDDYENVVGEEKTNLQAAIDAAEPSSADDYDSAASNFTSKTSTFTGAKANYDAFVAAKSADTPNLAYATSAKKTTVTDAKNVSATSASDADTKTAAIATALRAYYESHAAAENVATASDFTSRITNRENPTNTTGWSINNTVGNISLRTLSTQSYTDADGTNNHSYFDSNSWNTAFTSTITQDLTLPAGDYLLTVKARGDGTTTYKVIADDDDTDIDNSGNSGGVFGNGWNDYSVEFSIDDSKSVTLGIEVETGSSSNWVSFGDFRLVKLDATYADANDYENLAAAIATIEGSLGFDAGEYAPYNVASALATAKAFNPEVDNIQSEVQDATAALLALTTNANEVNAIYNPIFDLSENDGDMVGWETDHSAGLGGSMHARAFVLTSGGNYDKLAVFGQGAGTRSAGYFRWDGTNSSRSTIYTYGGQTDYTMPLKDAYYTVRADFGAWGQNGNKPLTLEVVNSSNTTIASQTINTPTTKLDESGTVVASFNLTFKASAANYKLRLKNGNTGGDQAVLISNFSLIRATVDEIKAVLAAEITAANKIYNSGANVGDGVFQIPTAAGNTFNTAINTTAQGVYDNPSATISDVATAIDNLKTAESTFTGTSLTAPDPDKRYVVTFHLSGNGSDGNAATYIHNGRSGEGDYVIQYLAANSNYAQAFKFTAVDGKKNQYYLSQIDVDGTERYMTTQKLSYSGNNTSAIRTTTSEDDTKYLPVEVQYGETAGQYYFINTTNSKKIGIDSGTSMYDTNAGKFSVAEASDVSVKVEIDNGKWGTRIFPFTVTIPDGLEAYTITGTSGKAIEKSGALASIPANKPVLLKATADVDETFTGYGAAKQDSYTEGLLTGVYTKAPIAASVAPTESDAGVFRYVLQTQDDVQAFYKVTSAFTATEYRCYLSVEIPKTEEVKAFYLDFNVETAVSSVKADELKDATIYNLAGQRVSKAQKGVYIINGKKVAVK